MPLVDATRIQRALLLLETLTKEETNTIITYMRKNEEADFLELLIHSRMESGELGLYLELLCDLNLLLIRNDMIGRQYRLNRPLYRRLIVTTERLAGGGPLVPHSH